MKKLPVFTAFFAALAYLAAHALTLLKIMWLPALALIAALAALMPSVLDAQLTAAGGESADPATVLAAMGAMFKSMGLLYLVMAIVYPMMIAGVLKHIVRGETPTLPLYLGYAGDELRVLGSIVLVIIMTVIVYVVGVLAIVALGLGLSAVSPALGGILGFVAALVFICAFIWFLLRLSVALPAAVGARTVGVTESWRMTKGNVWSLLLYWVLWVIVLIPVASVFMAVAMPDLMGVYGEMIAAGQDPAAQEAVSQRMLQMQRDMWDMSKPSFWPYIIAVYVYTIVYNAIWCVAAGVAYRYLTGEAGEAAAAA
ncbi:MAG: hypothetical protein RIE56_09125 [Amphiplicatus sp.]